MKTYIALLRAVNVGGTGKLPMADLRQMCMELGFEKVETYIQSGNLVFNSDESAEVVKAKLAARLVAYANKPIGVIIRNPNELEKILENNPYKDSAPNRVLVTFLDEIAPSLDGVRNQKGEEITLGEKEIYVHYGDGMAQSRLVIPSAKTGTARNINTVKKLFEMAQMQ